MLKLPFCSTVSEPDQVTVRVDSSLGELHWPPCLCKNGEGTTAVPYAASCFHFCCCSRKRKHHGVMSRKGRHFQKHEQKCSPAQHHDDSPTPHKCPPPNSLTALTPVAGEEASSSCSSSCVHVGALKAEEDKMTFSWVFWLCIRVTEGEGQESY